MKKKLLIIVYIALLSFFFVKNVDGLVVENAIDEFVLTDYEYKSDEKFVFTATLNFESGQAGGLTFGALEDSRYYVFNIDRYENKVKLLYFSKTDDNYDVKELFVDYFIGNDKMTDAEKNLVNPKVREIPNVDLKVVITPENDKVYAEFYADGIKRFGIDNIIDLNNINDFDVKYQGGQLGYNVFNAKVDFTDEEIGSSDYSYYTEMYRQQYHYSQYKNWNNDPNGLVYYNGYYHLFFQHHPYSKYWGDMYWGHARSKDLIHWEQLPICLFPDNSSGDSGYAWSGSARVYHKGLNPEMDSWFPNGDGNGLIAFYTRDGARQDQVIISSDDEGLTWTKRKVIPQSLVGISDRKISCRDPKVFQINNGSKDIWGMIISNMEDNTVYFLQSENMLDWSYAGQFTIYRPECVDVVEIVADDNTTHTVLTFEGREYLVGELKYDTSKNEIYFEKLTADGMMDVRGKSIEEIDAAKMDFGPDSYATQSFYIDDESSIYFGKTISLSWFSGVPGGAASVDSGAFAAVRSRFNGGGFTIPVELGLKLVDGQYLLTQTPITLNNEKIDKVELIKETNIEYNENSTNLLSNVDTHQLEIYATFDNPNNEDIEFKINLSEDEYTTVGWNKTDGYYVDRTYTSDGGINFNNYHVKYVSGPTEKTTQSFYILSDNGSIEVFCDDFSIPFYVLTLANVYSTKALLSVSGDVTINNLEVNEIKSIYHSDDIPSDEGVIYLDKDNVRLDLELSNKTEVIFYSTLLVDKTWEIVEGDDVVKITESQKGISIEALNSGNALIKVTCGNKEKTISVTVESGKVESDITFSKEGMISGNWYQSSEGLIGYQLSGDGFILSSEFVKDCYYTAKFDLGSGAAAALVLRADKDMKQYLIVNYDNNANIIKAWTQNGELGNVFVGNIDVKNITLSVILDDNHVTVLLNGKNVMEFDLGENDPKEGYLGLNICATEAVFKEITLQSTNFEYSSNNLVVKGNVSQYIQKIVNITLKNTPVDEAFYKTNGREIIISEEYFKTLKETGIYEFEIIGEYSTFTISVDVKALPSVKFNSLSITVGENLNIFIGNTKIDTLKVNGNLLTNEQYFINNMILTIDSKIFNLGDNSLEINGNEISVTLTSVPQTNFTESSGCGGSIVTSISSLVALVGVSLFILLKKRGK